MVKQFLQNDDNAYYVHGLVKLHGSFIILGHKNMEQDTKIIILCPVVPKLWSKK